MVSPPHTWSAKSLMAISWGHYRAYTFVLHLSRNHFHCLNIQCFQTFIYLSSFLFISSRMVNLVPVVSYWLESEVHIYFPLFNALFSEHKNIQHFEGNVHCTLTCVIFIDELSLGLAIVYKIISMYKYIYLYIYVYKYYHISLRLLLIA
jgi:hypothetical protein